MTDHSAHTPLDHLAAVFHEVRGLVAAVRNDQWANPTPCQEWNARALVNHMVLGNRLFAGILRGEAAVVPGALDPRAHDALGADPVAAYRDATQDLLAAFNQPGVLDRMFQVPVGLVPGIAALHLRAVEDAVHGWDLARAIGEEMRIPDEIVEQELEFTRAKLADVPAERSPFAPATTVPDGATPLDRLAALLGRPTER